MNNSDFLKKYFSSFDESLKNILVTDGDNKPVSYDKAVEEIVALLLTIQKQNKKVILVGNGGSAAIASHQAVDYWKNGKIRATAFNDSSLLTCLSNDYSYAEVFSKAIEMFGEDGDLVFCISSSGKSQNILNAAFAAKEKKCNVITFSGFEQENPLRNIGIFNFYLKNYSYGFVEIQHLLILHCILDAKMFVHDKIDIFNKNIPIDVS